MARYEPLPYVRPARERNLRLSDLYLRQGQAEAEAEQRRGDIQAQLWGNIGQVVGNTANQVVQGRQQERDQASRDAERAENAKLRGMQIGEAERQINDRENFDLAMGAGSRERTLAALKDRPELYQKAQTHFEAIDTSRKKMMGDVAAGVADFGYTPEAAMAALDDLIEQGFDEKRLDGLRGQIQSNPESVKQIVTSLLSQSPDPRHQAMAKPQPLVELNKDTSLYDPNKGEVVASGPQSPPPQAPNPTEASLALKAATGDPEAIKALELIRGQRPAPQGPAPSYQWAKDPSNGEVRLMSAQEIRTTGAGQPDTADMRNKQSGKRVAALAVDAVRDLSAGIFTKVGPAQRAQAIKRGADAVFGNDPEFRTYQDSRMALAGTLAVEQQGGRVSDADVKALWLPMVPDAYRDTKESYDLKWKLIDAMRGVDANAAQPGDIEYDMNGKPIQKKGKP